MFKVLLLPIILLARISFILTEAPDYRLTCLHIRENLDNSTISQLPAFLGKTSIENLTENMSAAAKDSVEQYTKQLNALQLGGPYNLSQLDSALKPYHLEIIKGINIFQSILYNINKTNAQRMFALQVLIGLYTNLEWPLNVTHILPRDEFIAHEIFLSFGSSDYSASATTTQLYEAYKRGVRVAQAKDDQVMINAVNAQAYKRAGGIIANILARMFEFIADQEHFKATGEIIFRTEGVNWGKIIRPGQEPIYTQTVQPIFPGGYINLKKTITEHLQYPEKEWDEGIEGVCMTKVVVEKDGSISDIKVTSSVSPGIDSEMINIIRKLPKWEPARLADGEPVRSQKTIIQYFRIKPGEKRENAFKEPVNAGGISKH